MKINHFPIERNPMKSEFSLREGAEYNSLHSSQVKKLFPIPIDWTKATVVHTKFTLFFVIITCDSFSQCEGSAFTAHGVQGDSVPHSGRSHWNSKP